MLYPVTVGSFRRFIQKKYKYETTAQKNGYSFVHQDFLDPHALIKKSRVILLLFVN
jgi:formylglycine-generating enzyme required for sulfatase activity